MSIPFLLTAGLGSYGVGPTTPITPPVITVADHLDGSGVTVTVAGGLPGAVNTLYQLPMTGNNGLWQAVGVINGNGSLAISGLGYFFWYALAAYSGQTAASNIIYQGATNQAVPAPPSTGGINALGDWRVWDNLEKASYLSVAVPSTSSVAYLLPTVKRRALTWKELAASGGVYTGQDRAFLLPVQQIPTGLFPKPADKLTDGFEVTWTVLEAPLNTQDTWYKLICRNIVLAYSLRDLISVARQTGAVDLAGNRTADRMTIYSGLPARCQLRSATRVDVRGKFVLEQDWDIYVQGPLTLQEHDQVLDENGTIYEVRGHEEPNRIDQLMTVHCKRWE